jgi:hypothetical protein
MPTIAERVERLEAEVANLRELLLAATSDAGKRWQRTIGAFTDDPGMQQILKDAMKLREADRKKTKRRRA